MRDGRGVKPLYAASDQASAPVFLFNGTCGETGVDLVPSHEKMEGLCTSVLMEAGVG